MGLCRHLTHFSDQNGPQILWFGIQGGLEHLKFSKHNISSQTLIWRCICYVICLGLFITNLVWFEMLSRLCSCGLQIFIIVWTKRNDLIKIYMNIKTRAGEGGGVTRIQLSSWPLINVSTKIFLKEFLRLPNSDTVRSKWPIIGKFK